MSIAAKLRRAAAPAAKWPAMVAVVSVFATVLAGELALHGGTGRAVHFADAGDEAAVARGAALYQGHCAACHGAQLQGQPGWQVIAADGILRAPPQNDTGHTWMHSDAELFDLVKYGTADFLPPGLVSPMPVFAGQLTDVQIEDTLAFVKSHWSIGVRAYQALLNPGRAGMPKAASAGAWLLPPDCQFELLRSRPRPARAKKGKA